MDNLLRSVEKSPVFAETAAPYLLIDRDLTIQGANSAYLSSTGRTREELLGAYVFEAFPDNPDNPCADGVHNLGTSLEQVLRSSQRSHMWVQRYDIPSNEPDDPFILKYWSPINSPVRDDHGRAAGVLHHVEDVTSIWAPADGSDESVSGATGGNGAQEAATSAAAMANNERAYASIARENRQLREALTSRVLIEQAKGIVMAERRCGQQEAFEMLRRHSQNSNIKLRDLAAELVSKVEQPGTGHG